MATFEEKLTQEQEDFLFEKINLTKNITHISKEFIEKFGGGSVHIDSMRRNVSRFYEKHGLTNNKVKLEDSEQFKEATKRKLKDSKYYIICWQQNETPIYLDFWNNVLAYANFLNAEISVILGRYKNPTSVFSDIDKESWDPITQEYWDASRHSIHQHLNIISDVKISPTAKYPLRSMAGISGGKSAVFGHPNFHLQVEPSLHSYVNRTLFTTGAITMPNYTDSKSGKIGEKRHKFGFVIVEIKNDDYFYIRQVEGKQDGSFIDLFYSVENQEVTRVNKAAGLFCGDTHHRELDPAIDKLNDELCDIFNIKTVAYNDIIDGESVNNHLEKNPIKQYRRFKEGDHLIQKELDDLKEWLSEKPHTAVIIDSNHNDRFDRALAGDWRKDIINAEFYMEYTKLALEGKLTKGVVSYFLEKQLGSKVICLTTKDSYKLGKYESSQHGHIGINGAKGSSTSFVNLDIPILTAHTHTSFRFGDYLMAGCNCHVDASYLKGASSWQQSTILVHDNDTAQHIIFVDGDYTIMDKK